MPSRPCCPVSRHEVAALIPLDQDSALLPNAALLDVLPMALLAPLLEAAQRADLRGLAGWVSYRGHRLPALQLEALLGHDRAPPGLRGRLVVLQGVSSPEARPRAPPGPERHSVLISTLELRW